MPESRKEIKILMIAGEVSGDLAGAGLIKELKKLDENIKVFGIGGDKMREAGMELSYHINKMAFLGFTEVVKHIPFIKRVQRELIELVKQNKIEIVVLIDYPGFNLSFAKKLKAYKTQIIYYISPQIWAWGKGRMKTIRTYVDKMIVVFPFEEELYKSNNVNAVFVGHPLLERLESYNYLSKEELEKKFELTAGKDILLIMPGSRKHEIEKIFKPCINAASKLANQFNLQIVVACASNIDKNLFHRFSDQKNFKVISGYTYDLMKISKIGIIKSGTSTLEAAIAGLPMVIVYKTSLPTYLIGRTLVKIKSIGMANIILGEQVVPELIQHRVNESEIIEACNKILSDSSQYQRIKEKLLSVKDKIGSAGASARAAENIFKVINENQRA
jgi:lipid-A-disaccharide synthase